MVLRKDNIGRVAVMVDQEMVGPKLRFRRNLGSG